VAPTANSATSRSRVGSLVAALLAFLALGCGCESRPDPANVVLISVDTLRWDHVGLYGAIQDTTPHIDRFFRGGTVFESASATAPCTVPSVRQFLSGGFDVGAERAPLAEVLQERGFATAAIASQQHFVHERERDYARGFEHFDLQGEAEADHHGLSTRTADAVSDRALAWLEQRPQDTPFFLWLHYFDPHDPYEPPPEHRLFGRGSKSDRSGDRRAQLMAGRSSPDEEWNRAGAIFSKADVAHLRALYAGEIHFADAQIGRVLEALEAAGLVESSIVALTSDHGEWLGEGGWWDHCITLRDQEIRVPLLLRVRGAPLAGRPRDPVPASTLDLVPTILGLLEIAASPGSYHGSDLRLRAPDRSVMAFWGHLALARDVDWKLYLDGQRPILERARPPARTGETGGAAGQRAQERLAGELTAAAELRQRVTDDWRATLRKLQAIGYVE
jgi:arylsulfatase A-like enzyme